MFVKVSRQTWIAYTSTVRDYNQVGAVMEARQGQVVKEYKVGNTHIKVYDDDYYTKTQEDVKAILLRIADKVHILLSAQTN